MKTDTKIVIKIDTINIAYQADPLHTLQQLRKLPYLVCLDSGRPAAQDDASRYDIISAGPSEIVDGSINEAETRLAERLDQSANNSNLPFTGGWIGYIGYEYRHPHFKLPSTPKSRALWFGWYDWAIVHDHHEQRSFLIYTDTCARDTLQKVEVLINQAPPAPSAFQCKAFNADMARTDYLKKVQHIRDYIYAGDCYQVNLAQRFSAHYKGGLLTAYQRLRKAVPSPYGAFLALKNETILSISPERFIRIAGRQATTEPIKGTTGRGATPEEDQKFKTALLESTKNRAENLMIVDLLRNDFSQNCEPHSVKVPRLFELHSFANVHHLISTVEGTLKPEVSQVAFLFDCFPGGSITGAPKKRAMEIIEELENVQRGPYCGAIGFFSSNEISEFNIAIRTFQQQDDVLYCWGGGGIVADSDPEAEYQEIHHKVGALMQSLQA